MEKNNDHIFAAGGILWSGEPFHSEIAVIHRNLYGSEWCLPKGKEKSEDNGSLEATALREIREETGCKARTIGFADTTEYKVDELKKKRVFFWHMRLKGKCRFKPSEEVDRLIWLPLSEAVKILTHPDQIEILEKAKLPIPPTAESVFSIYTPSAGYHRLAGSMMSYRNEIEYRFDETTSPKDKINELLNKAESALKQKKLDEAWKCFHGAQRMEIFSLDKEELRYKAECIVNETEKLSSWRKKAVEALLGTPGNIKESLEKEQVYEAAFIRDEHYDNTAYKDILLKNHIALLAAITFIILAIILIFTLRNIYLDPAATVLLYGIFGGAFSAVLKVPSDMKSSRIPELTQSFRLTLLRIFTGAASALIIYQFLQSDFAKDLFNFSISQNQTYYIIAFVSGFSERLVLKAVSIVSKI